MSVRQTTVAMGFSVGMVLGAVVLTAFGQKSSPDKASRNPQVIAPRYSVQWESEQRLLLITDNFYNRLYMYSTKQGTKLTSYIDLRQTGAGQLRAIGPPKSTTSKGKKAASSKPKTKPKTKPKARTTKKKSA